MALPPTDIMAQGKDAVLDYLKHQTSVSQGLQTIAWGLIVFAMGGLLILYRQARMDKPNKKRRTDG